jgi:hypothetical protein
MSRPVIRARAFVQKSKRRDRAYGASAQAILLIWAVPALFSVYCKYSTTPFYIAAAHLGRAENVTVVGQVVRRFSVGLTVWEKLSFFRNDLLLGFLIVPAALLLLLLLSRRFAVATTVLLAGLSSVVLFVQLRAFGQAGQFVSVYIMREAIKWMLGEPAGLSYAFREVARLALFSCVIGALIFTATRLRSVLPPQTVPIAAKLRATTVVVLTVLGLAATALAWTPPIPGTAYHRSVLLRAIGSLFGAGERDTREFRGLSFPALLHRYREISHEPQPSRNLRYWGKQANANVIFIVWETASYRAVPLDQNLDDFPNLRRLQQHAFVGLNHHTTFPATTEALFSLFTSWYPDDGAIRLVNLHPKLSPPDLMRALAQRGYATAIYSPHSDNQTMFEVLGVPVRVPPGKPAGSIVEPLRGQEEAWSPKARIARDLATLKQMKEDMTQWLAQGRKFSIAFLPQISHAPFFEIGGPEPDLLKRSRALLAHEDAWIGELMDLLQRYDALDNTVIVVVGDHGVRTRFEDPACPVGMLDDYTYHVPLLMYAPRALAAPQKIDWVTSHIDVAPTVLDLLGMAENRGSEQGTPIWNSQLQGRTTYFFGRPFLGSDGYYREGKFYLWSYPSDSVYINEHQHFEPRDLVSERSPTFHEVEGAISRITALQEVWLARFDAKEAPLRSHIY